MKSKKKTFKESKHLSNAQENTNRRLTEMRTIQDFRTEFSQERETLTRTQADKKTELEKQTSK